MMEMKECTNKKCGKFGDGIIVGNYCSSCGYTLGLRPMCKCKTPIGKYDNFCVTCGRPCK